MRIMHAKASVRISGFVVLVMVLRLSCKGRVDLVLLNAGKYLSNLLDQHNFTAWSEFSNASLYTFDGLFVDTFVAGFDRFTGPVEPLTTNFGFTRQSVPGTGFFPSDVIAFHRARNAAVAMSARGRLTEVRGGIVKALS